MNQQQATELKADFDRDGVVILRNFVAPERVKEICRRAEAATRNQPVRKQWSNITKGMERLDKYFGEILNDGEHIPILEMLIGKKPEATTASFFTKNDNDQEVHPHSDAIDGGVIWIALDEVNKENGCLHFLKGSHLREEEFAHLKAHEPTDFSGHVDLLEASMSPGDIVFFRPTTVHWSGPNLDGSERRGFNCFYVGDPFKGGKGKKGTKEKWEKWKGAKQKKAQTVQ
jgi:phytanoyl-CoA hydroxylase